MQRRRLITLLAAAPFAPLRAASEWAPDRPIRFVVGFAAGGSTDTTARLVAEAITARLGQQVLVENRTGAGGNIASEYVARSAPDGYTFAVGSMGTHAVNQTLFRGLPFHVQRDFTPVSLLVLSPVLLVVHPSVPITNVAELIARARANPAGLSAGTGGGGTSQHLSAEIFEQKTGVRFTKVHYRGGAPAIADLVGGRLTLIFAPFVEAIQQVRAGELRAIGFSGTERSPILPEVPTIAEQVPGFQFTSWLALFGPASTPGPVVARVSGEVAAAMRQPRLRERLAQLGYEPVGSTAEELGRFQATEVQRVAELVRLSGAAIE